MKAGNPMRLRVVILALCVSVTLSLALMAQARTPSLPSDTITGPRAISGTPTSALQCLSGNAANVHNLGWLAAGGRYTITFDSPITLKASIVRLDLSQSSSAVIDGDPGFDFTSSSSGTMALHVSGNGQSGCYRYQVLMDPSAASTARIAARTDDRARQLRAVSTRATMRTFAPLALSGTPSSAYHCVGGKLIPNVHELGRVDQASDVTITFDADFNAIAAVTMMSLEPGAGPGSFAIDDDSGGNGNPALSVRAEASENVVLYVAGVGGATGCYRYQVQIR